MFHRFAFFALAIALIGTATARSAPTAAPGAALPLLVGTWSCNAYFPVGTSLNTVTFSPSGIAGWLSYKDHSTPAGPIPGHDLVGIFGYDTKAHQYVTMSASTVPGQWSVSVGKASPEATTVTFSGYPEDPSHMSMTYVFGAATVTWTSTWTQQGKTMAAHGNCTKQ